MNEEVASPFKWRTSPEVKAALEESMAIGMGGHSPSNIAHHLKHIHFPCSKGDLVKQAQTNQAENEVLEVLRQMPDHQYQSMADVMKGVGEVE